MVSHQRYIIESLFQILIKFQSVQELVFTAHIFFSCKDALGTTLAAHLDKPRVYIGCMKSGEVFSEP